MLDYPLESKTVLFNSLYGSIVLLEKSEKEKIIKLLKNPHSDEFLINNADTKLLYDQKFLINDDIDEFSIVENRKKYGIEDKNRLDVVLIPTLDCNFSCKYCYENPIESSMHDFTDKSLIMWLNKEIPKYKLVLIHWYGGEPLLEINRILTISDHIKKIAKTNNVGLAIHVTTNGYYFNKKNIFDLVNCNITDFQVTLDGSEKHHDELRVLKNGKATFKKIFQNIIDLALIDSNVKISLRTNFNHTNLNSIPELLNQFPVKIRNQLRVIFEPIFGNCQMSAIDNIETNLLFEKLSMYYKLAEDLGYDVILGLSTVYIGKLVYCYAERMNQYIINYNGDVYKCSVSDFSKKDRVGYINNQGNFIIEKVNYSKWIKNKLFEEKCSSCKYLPLCMGGCRKMILKHNSPEDTCKIIPANTYYFIKQMVFAKMNNLGEGRYYENN